MSTINPISARDVLSFLALGALSTRFQGQRHANSRSPRVADRSRALVLRIFRRTLVASLWIAAGMASASAADVRQTHTSGKTCISSVGETHETTCAGPVGYVAVIRNRDDAIDVNFLDAADQPSGLALEKTNLIWRGLAPFIGNEIEWRLIRGEPYAAIVRIFTVGSDERLLEQFLVARVTRSGSCEIARIDASESSAYATARHLADSQASNITCAPK